MMKAIKFIIATSLSFGTVVGASSVAQASTFTDTSPIGSGSTVPTGVSTVGGVVLDLLGANNNRVTTQLSASSLFTGFANTNPFEIGTQTGFTSSVTDALGGGIAEAAVRFTLFDGDTAENEFDEQDNTLLLNGIAFGNWSDVEAQNTDGTGNALAAGFSGGGFRNDLLDTGWFFNDDSSVLSALFNSLTATQQVVFGLDDVDPGDNFYDFTLGIDSGLINTGTGPVVTPGGNAEVPTPALLPGLIGMGVAALRKRKGEAAAEA